MKETTHYKLNQWELTDLIQMDDFNADNTKLDNALAALSARVDAAGDSSALAAKLGRTEIVWDQTSSSSFDWKSLDPRAESWDDWDLYGILFQPGLSQCGSGDSVYLELISSSGARTQTDLPLGGFLTLLLPWHDAQRTVQGIVIGAGSALVRASFPFQDLSLLGFGLTSSQGHMFDGNQTTIFGLR